MKTKFAILAIGIGMIAAAFDPASAADWNNGAGRIKDYGRGGVPVPAPVPIPDYYAKWYLRLDAGVGFVSEPSVTERGMMFGLTDSPGTTGPTPFGSSPSWFQKDFDTSATWGLGAGYYWTPRFRTDVTGDVRSQQQVKLRGSYRYQQHEYVPPAPGTYLPVGDGTTTSIWIDGTVRDDVIHRSGTILFNAYYDLMKHGGFTPYVGVGLGVAINELERRHNHAETITACDSAALPPCGAPAHRSAFASSDKTHLATFAWAAMAGASYQLSERTLLDVNYRYLHTGGVSTTLMTANGASKITIGDMGEHKLRAGLRFNIQ